jgi:catechol 2,3-dioxygenase-like lactoylglutathione lyase family enzyme
MHARYYHTCIVAREPMRLAEFYVEVFGCTMTGSRYDLGGDALSRGMGLDNAHITGLDLLLPGYGPEGPVLEIFSLEDARDRHPEVNDHGIMHLAFSVDDVDDTLSRLIGAGGSSIGEVSVLKVAGAGEATMVYARDPEDNVIEIQRWDRMPEQ